MNTTVTFDEIVDHIQSLDQRYTREAYHFVREALDYTQERIHKASKTAKPRTNNHVTGQELLDGIRKFTLESFGPMSLFVLHQWGLKRCEDFGEIVFNLVDHGQGTFNKTPEDSRDDFKGGYCFETAFRDPFLPSHRLRKATLEAKPN